MRAAGDLVSATVRVVADRDVCIGARMCVLAAPTVFDQDDAGIVVVLAPDVPEEEPRHVVSLCPSGALHLIESDGSGSRPVTG